MSVRMSITRGMLSVATLSVVTACGKTRPTRPRLSRLPVGHKRLRPPTRSA